MPAPHCPARTPPRPGRRTVKPSGGRASHKARLPGPVLEQPAPAEPAVAATVEAALSVASVASVAAPVRPVAEAGPRELPTLPERPAAARFEAVTTGLVSKPANFTQQARSTGDLVVRDRVVRLDLGDRTPGGDPGRRPYGRARHGAGLHHRRCAVARQCRAILHAEGRGGRVAEHAVRAVERPRSARAGTGWPGTSCTSASRSAATPPAAPDSGTTEIRSMREWFDPDGADAVTCRQAFTLLWPALRRHGDARC